MELYQTGYYTILIPWSDTPTEWHPTGKGPYGPFEVLSRGAFRTEPEAHCWATKHLAGNTYTVRFIEPAGENEE
jgi:hypothetical protein